MMPEIFGLPLIGKSGRRGETVLDNAEEEAADYARFPEPVRYVRPEGAVQYKLVWRTIGGGPGPGGQKHHGGTPVLIDDATGDVVAGAGGKVKSVHPSRVGKERKSYHDESGVRKKPHQMTGKQYDEWLQDAMASDDPIEHQAAKRSWELKFGGKQAHAAGVMRALEFGHDVPDEVKKEYLGLDKYNAWATNARVWKEMTGKHPADLSKLEFAKRLYGEIEGVPWEDVLRGASADEQKEFADHFGAHHKQFVKTAAGWKNPVKGLRDYPDLLENRMKSIESGKSSLRPDMPNLGDMKNWTLQDFLDPNKLDLAQLPIGSHIRNAVVDRIFELNAQNEKRLKEMMDPGSELHKKFGWNQGGNVGGPPKPSQPVPPPAAPVAAQAPAGKPEDVPHVSAPAEPPAPAPEPPKPAEITPVSEPGNTVSELFEQKDKINARMQQLLAVAGPLGVIHDEDHKREYDELKLQIDGIKKKIYDAEKPLRDEKERKRVESEARLRDNQDKRNEAIKSLPVKNKINGWHIVQSDDGNYHVLDPNTKEPIWSGPKLTRARDVARENVVDAEPPVEPPAAAETPPETVEPKPNTTVEAPKVDDAANATVRPEQTPKPKKPSGFKPVRSKPGDTSKVSPKFGGTPAPPKPAPKTSPAPAPTPAPATDTRDLQSFADMVHRIAHGSRQDQRFYDNKMYISDVFDEVKKMPGYENLSRDEFNRMLNESFVKHAMKDDRWSLSRADMVQAMPEDKVRASETFHPSMPNDLSAARHFVTFDPKKPPSPKPAPAPSQTQKKKIGRPRGSSSVRDILKDATDAGMPHQHLHTMAREFADQTREYDTSVREVRSRAIELAKGLGYGDYGSIAMRDAKGKMDEDSIRGLDDVAERLVDDGYGALLGKNPLQKLYDILKGTIKATAGDDENYRRAFEWLMENGWSDEGMFGPAKGPPLTAASIPYQRPSESIQQMVRDIIYGSS